MLFFIIVSSEMLTAIRFPHFWWHSVLIEIICQTQRKNNFNFKEFMTFASAGYTEQHFLRLVIEQFLRKKLEQFLGKAFLAPSAVVFKNCLNKFFLTEYEL